MIHLAIALRNIIQSEVGLVDMFLIRNIPGYDRRIRISTSDFSTSGGLSVLVDCLGFIYKIFKSRDYLGSTRLEC